MANVMPCVTELNLCHNRLTDISGLQCVPLVQRRLARHTTVTLPQVFSGTAAALFGAQLSELSACAHAVPAA